jgi:hypothetical protein
MTTYTDLLPPTKSEPRGAGIDWTPSAADGPKAGVLTIKQKRVYVTYTVCEFPTDWRGRAFMLAKLDEGSDPTEEKYACFVAANGQDRRCECRGFAYTGACKRLAALQTLIEAGQL